MKNKVIVVGAGAAGLTAAGYAARRGLDVILLERKEKPARKLMITGKGRCNITNDCDDLQELIAAVPVNGRFLYSAFSAFQPKDTVAMIESMGVKTKVERGRRVFPVSDKAADVVDALVRFARSGGARLLCARAVDLQIEGGKVTGVRTQEGSLLPCDAVILATGGASYPQTGSSGDGYAMAQKAGHTVTEIQPSLVPLIIHEGWCTELQGLSLRNAGLKVFDTKKKKVIYTDFGEMMFTHYGVTGPMILSASSHMRGMEPGRYRLSIDLKPALSIEQLDARILRDFTEHANKDYINSLHGLLPGKLIPVMVKRSGIPAGLKVNQITKEMRRTLSELLKNLELTVTGFRPLEEAIITSGGVAVSQVNPKTMQSKKVPNLYFAGELLDVDAYTGGYNLQIAFSTGYLAGISVLEEEDYD